MKIILSDAEVKLAVHEYLSERVENSETATIEKYYTNEPTGSGELSVLVTIPDDATD